MEVAGIYKKFKTDSPLAVRMEEIAATPPPRAKPIPKTGVLAQYFNEFMATQHFTMYSSTSSSHTLPGHLVSIHF